MPNRLTIHTVNLGLGDDSLVQGFYGQRKVGDRQIVSWGKDNLHPLKLLEYAGANPQVKSILETQAGMIAAEGFFFEGPAAADAATWAEEVGLNTDLLQRLAFDAALFGAVALRVVSTRAEMEGRQPGTRRYSQLIHQRVAEVRAVIPEDHEGIKDYITAADWSVIGPLGGVKGTYRKYALYEPQHLPAFNAKFARPLQLMYSFRYHPAMYFYPLPDLESILIHAEAQRRIIEYHNNSLANGVASNLVIRYPFQSSGNDEADANDQRAIVEQISDRLSGNANAGKPIIMFYSADAEETPSIEPIRIDENGQKYIETNKNLERSINVGLGVVSPELYGMTSPGGFSSQADLLLAANDIQYSNKIRPLQMLITRSINQLLKAEGIEATAELTNSLPVVMRITPQMVAQGLFSVDEFREMYGYEPNPDLPEPVLDENPPQPDASIFDRIFKRGDRK